MSGYSKIYCFDCHTELGWASDCGPGPIYLCDSCLEKEIRETGDD